MDGRTESMRDLKNIQHLLYVKSITVTIEINTVSYLYSGKSEKLINFNILGLCK